MNKAYNKARLRVSKLKTNDIFLALRQAENLTVEVYQAYKDELESRNMKTLAQVHTDAMNH